MTAGSFDIQKSHLIAAKRNAQKAMKSGHIPALLSAFSFLVPASFKVLRGRDEWYWMQSRLEYRELLARRAPAVDVEPERWGQRHNRRWRHKLQGA